jgi:hypothetical protein
MGDHLFKIVNKDGQFAETPFTADPPTITQVFVPPANDAPIPPGTKQVPGGKQSVGVSVVGSGLRIGSIVKWTAANANEPTQLAPSAVRSVDKNNLNVTLISGDPGPATLSVITPKGFSATVTVTVI